MNNAMETALRQLYDHWEAGIKYEQTDGYSRMFRMGVTEEYMEPGKRRILYYGQECLSMSKEKTTDWIRKYQLVQRAERELPGFNEKPNYSPFWRFYRAIYKSQAGNAAVLWGNLNKLHLTDPADKSSSPRDRQGIARKSLEPIRDLNVLRALSSPYGSDSRSVIQREIEVLQPTLIVFAIGPKSRYITSLAAAFGVLPEAVARLKPTKADPAKRMEAALSVAVPVIWTYHPAYLSRIQGFDSVIDAIRSA